MLIRTRITLLACAAIFSVVAAFYVEYRNIDKNITQLKHAHVLIQEAKYLSALVHSLQKERGLSGGFLLKHTGLSADALNQQRKRTNLLLAEHANNLKQIKIDVFFRHLIKEIAFTRAQIDADRANWKEVRNWYSKQIEKFLDIITQESNGNISLISFYPIINLSLARENLGILRAEINRLYLKKFSQSALQDIASATKFYQAYSNSFRSFLRDSTPYLRERFETKVVNLSYQQVIDEIENALLGTPQKESLNAPTIWWDKVTRAIDFLKQIEEAHFKSASAQIAEEVSHKETYLWQYGVSAIILTCLVSLIAVLTILRILQALNILLKSLDSVVSTQDFAMRICNTREHDEFGRIALSVNSLLDFTDRVIKEKDDIANTDLLTGLMNRRSFLKRCRDELKRDDRHAHGVALIFCDLDYFKKINDIYGHGCGDLVLQRFSQLLLNNSRSTDTVARWGGEEFILLIHNSRRELLEILSEKLRAAVERLSVPPIEHLSCSFGIATRQHNEPFELLCNRADEALYKAKALGRNQVCFAEDLKS